jgi:pilus assembly protein CpaB
MRMKSIVLIIIALGCGLVASIGISEVLKQKPNGQVAAVETEEVLVAAMDIDIGTKLDPQNIRLEPWPKDRIPEGVLRALEDGKDMFTSARLYAGEPILSAKLMDSTGEHATTKIPDGYVVIPVKVELDTVIGLIQPGDHVDVMVFLRQGPDIPRTDTFTIIRMARVFAVNSQMNRAVDEKGQEIAAKTVSLLVKPRQGEKVTLATELGKIRLALRRPTDKIPNDEEVEASLPAIFRGGEIVAMDKKPEPTPEPKIVEVTPIIPQLPPQIIAPPEPPPPPPVAWTMKLMTPTEVRQFDWENESSLPAENGAAVQIQGTNAALSVE